MKLHNKRKLSFIKLHVFAFSFLLLPQTVLATIIEYSLSGEFYYFEYDNGTKVGITDAVLLSGMALIDDNKFPFYLPDDPDCPSGPDTFSCDATFNFTYFEMAIGGEYEFTGTDGYLTYTGSDTYGNLNGTGDLSSMYHTSESNLGSVLNYEQWLTFELPDIITWNGLGLDQITVNNPLLEDMIFYFEVTLSKVGPLSVPEPTQLVVSIIALLSMVGALKTRARKNC